MVRLKDGPPSHAAGPAPPQETTRMTRIAIGTEGLTDAATYALALTYFTSFVVAIEVALGKLVY